MYNKAIEILVKLNKYGYEAYIVGGYPRDKYLGIESNDIDICTNAPLEFILENFEIKKVNKQFKSIIIENKYDFEITCFRKDYYTDSRYPVVETVNTLEEDLIRRDFTINTLCINLNGDYIDLYNSIDDINKKIIRMIGEPNLRLKEDPLRILRAIRFSLKYNFEIDFELEKAIINHSDLINNISLKLKKREIDKMLEFCDYDRIMTEFKKYNLEVDLCKKN